MKKRYGVVPVGSSGLFQQARTKYPEDPQSVDDCKPGAQSSSLRIMASRRGTISPGILQKLLEKTWLPAPDLFRRSATDLQIFIHTQLSISFLNSGRFSHSHVCGPMHINFVYGGGREFRVKTNNQIFHVLNRYWGRDVWIWSDCDMPAVISQTRSKDIIQKRWQNIDSRQQAIENSNKENTIYTTHTANKKKKTKDTDETKKKKITRYTKHSKQEKENKRHWWVKKKFLNDKHRKNSVSPLTARQKQRAGPKDGVHRGRIRPR